MYIELGKKFFQNFFNNPSLKIQIRLFFQNKITNYNEKTLRLPPNNIEGLKRSNSPYSFPNFVKRNKKKEKRKQRTNCSTVKRGVFQTVSLFSPGF